MKAHGVKVDTDIFVNAGIPQEGTTYDSDSVDLRLRPGSAAADRGVTLPNVNDGYGGRAPDLGAFERGGPLPHYGPREEASGSDFNGDGEVGFLDFVLFVQAYGQPGGV